MAYKKRGPSSEADIALNRIEGMKKIDPAFDFGQGLNITAYQSLIDKVNQGVKTYNGFLTDADAVAATLDTDSKALSDMNSRALNAVGGKYGFNSSEYKEVGGTRQSDYKHAVRKNKPTTPAK
jgi:prophage DNA circulation protein